MTEEEQSQNHSYMVWQMYLHLCSNNADPDYMYYLIETSNNTLLQYAIRLVDDFNLWDQFKSAN